jgi:PAS domain S-box-containing protein
MLTDAVALIEVLFDPLGGVVYCVKDLKGRYVSANSAFAARAGRESKAEVLGKTAMDLFPAYLAREYEAQDRRIIATGDPVLDRLECIRNSDGSIGWYVTNKRPLRDAARRMIGIVSVSQDLDEPAESSLKFSRLAKVAEHIRAYLDEPLRVETLAKLTGLSVTQFERRMRKVFRLSPKQFVIKCRMDEATRLLAETKQSLGEIALACGFNDQSAFSRQFKSAMGTTPGEFRRAGNLR